MLLPALKTAKQKTARRTVVFGGVNYTPQAAEGELSASRGITSASYPALSQREPRRVVESYEAPTALYARDAVFVVDGTRLLIDGREAGKVTPGEKQFAAVNTRVCIFPDKLVYDSQSEQLSSMEAEYNALPGSVTFTDTRLNITLQWYADVTAEESSTMDGLDGTRTVTVYRDAAINQSTGELNLEVSTAKTVEALSSGDLVQIDCLTNEYQVVKDCYPKGEDGTWRMVYDLHRSTRMIQEDLRELFRAGDAVEITGCTDNPDNNKTAIVREVEQTYLAFTQNAITAGSESGGVTIARRAPDLTYVCEWNNRLWGVEGNTIYASALGDPNNFYVYDGLSTDSYAVAVGTPGPFTGIAATSSGLIAFKEECLHKVLGTSPKNYEVYAYDAPGIQAGSHKSAVIINEALFYKGARGIYAYTGSLPELLTANFGTRRFTGAVAGTDGQRYAVSMLAGDGQWEYYTFDPGRGVWLMEDNTHAVDFAQIGGKMCFLNGDGELIETGSDAQEKVYWSAEFAPFTEGGPGKKGYSRLWLRLKLEPSAWVRVETSADGGPFQQVLLTGDKGRETITIPLLPGRCDSFRVKLSGKGKCMVLSMAREFVTGSW